MIGNIVLNLLFIPRHGFIAAAIITGVSEAFVFAMLLFFTLHVVKNMPKYKG